MFLPYLLVLPPSCLSDQECGQISTDLQKELGKELYSVTDQNRQNRIVQGQPAPTHSIPWQAQLYIRNLADNSSDTCGGVVIARLFVMTSGHCASEQEQHQVEEVWLGRNNRQSGGSRYGVAEVFIHPVRPRGKSPKPKAYDMALVKLARAISYTA